MEEMGQVVSNYMRKLLVLQIGLKFQLKYFSKFPSQSQIL